MQIISKLSKSNCIELCSSISFDSFKLFCLDFESVTIVSWGTIRVRFRTFSVNGRFIDIVYFTVSTYASPKLLTFSELGNFQNLRLKLILCCGWKVALERHYLFRSISFFNLQDHLLKCSSLSTTKNSLWRWPLSACSCFLIVN